MITSFAYENSDSDQLFLLTYIREVSALSTFSLNCIKLNFIYLSKGNHDVKMLHTFNPLTYDKYNLCNLFYMSVTCYQNKTLYNKIFGTNYMGFGMHRTD